MTTDSTAEGLIALEDVVVSLSPVSPSLFPLLFINHKIPKNIIMTIKDINKKLYFKFV